MRDVQLIFQCLDYEQLFQYLSWKISRSFVSYSEYYQVIKAVTLRWKLGATQFLVSFSRTKKRKLRHCKSLAILCCATVIRGNNVCQRFYDSKTCHGLQISTGCWNRKSSVLYMSHRFATTRLVKLSQFSNVVGITKVTEAFGICVEKNNLNFYEVLKTLHKFKAKTIGQNKGTARFPDSFR